MMLLINEKDCVSIKVYVRHKPSASIIVWAQASGDNHSNNSEKYRYFSSYNIKIEEGSKFSTPEFEEALSWFLRHGFEEEALRNLFAMMVNGDDHEWNFLAVPN